MKVSTVLLIITLLLVVRLAYLSFLFADNIAQYVGFTHLNEYFAIMIVAILLKATVDVLDKRDK